MKSNTYLCFGDCQLHRIDWQTNTYSPALKGAVHTGTQYVMGISAKARGDAIAAESWQTTRPLWRGQSMSAAVHFNTF